MGLLETVESPADLRRLEPGQLGQLAQEPREFLIHPVGAAGGHLGPNHGVVEFTLAIHRLFGSPYAPIVVDTGRKQAR